MNSQQDIGVEDDVTSRWLQEFESLENRWKFPTLNLRQNFDYFRTLFGSRKPYSSELLYRLQNTLDKEFRNTKALEKVLNGIQKFVADAIDDSRSDAYAAWDKHEVWLSVIDETIQAEYEPGAMLVESLSLLGGGGDYSSKNMCAALGLWCFGEYQLARKDDDQREALRLLEQISLVLSEAEFCRGQDAKTAQSRKHLSQRNRAAALVGHERDRTNKLAAFMLWESRNWRVQADAEREISRQCNVVQAVAGRWIREFKRAPDAYRAMQSKYPALQRP